MIPTKAQNPLGLHQRYAITKADGAACDPQAVYFVLRLDNQGDDDAHIRACRAAADAYYDAVQRGGYLHLMSIANELKALVQQLRAEPKKAANRVAGQGGNSTSPNR